MIEQDFFQPDEIEEILIGYCTSKIDNIIDTDDQKKLFLCGKEGYEGIFSRKKSFPTIIT